MDKKKIECPCCGMRFELRDYWNIGESVECIKCSTILKIINIIETGVIVVEGKACAKVIK